MFHDSTREIWAQPRSRVSDCPVHSNERNSILLALNEVGDRFGSDDSTRSIFDIIGVQSKPKERNTHGLSAFSESRLSQDSISTMGSSGEQIYPSSPSQRSVSETLPRVLGRLDEENDMSIIVVRRLGKLGPTQVQKLTNYFDRLCSVGVKRVVLLPSRSRIRHLGQETETRRSSMGFVIFNRPEAVDVAMAKLNVSAGVSYHIIDGVEITSERFIRSYTP